MIERPTVDVLPPAKAGQTGDVRFEIGRRIGSDARAVDLHLRLAPGEVRTIDLRGASRWCASASRGNGPWRRSGQVIPVGVHLAPAPDQRARVVECRRRRIVVEMRERHRAEPIRRLVVLRQERPSQGEPFAA